MQDLRRYFSHIYRDLYGDAILVPCNLMGTMMARKQWYNDAGQGQSPNGKPKFVTVDLVGSRQHGVASNKLIGWINRSSTKCRRWWLQMEPSWSDPNLCRLANVTCKTRDKEQLEKSRISCRSRDKETVDSLRQKLSHRSLLTWTDLIAKLLLEWATFLTNMTALSLSSAVI